MIIPLAIVIGLQGHEKPAALEKRLLKAEGLYASYLKKADTSFSRDIRTNATLSSEFESIARQAGKQPIAIEAWTLALVSGRKEVQRENLLLDQILPTKLIRQDQYKVLYPYAEDILRWTKTFMSETRVLKVVDLLVERAPSKEQGSKLLLEKANWLDDTNDLKWDVYNRLVDQFAGTQAASEARTILLRKKHLQPGDQFPDFISKDSNGQPFRLSMLRGKVVVLEFWANWCPSCQRTIPVSGWRRAATL